MMSNRLIVLLQYLLPQHTISRLVGWCAEARVPWFKNLFIAWFIKKYRVNMAEAAVEDYREYQTFNDFFIRKLKTNARTIATDVNGIVSPADGAIAQLGNIIENQMLQAKGHQFDLTSLLAGDQALANLFFNGAFATIYLAPYNYHRVHMPLDGKLVQTIYVPGKLFSVNQQTATYIPQLYSRNERFICIFESNAGRFALIFVGALIVAGIQTAWMNVPVRSQQLLTETFSSPLTFTKGDELGYFKLGSTVILLFEKNRSQWLTSLHTGSTTQFGQLIGHAIS